MKLSVIVPAYRLEQFIAPCLESLLTQDVDCPFEVIVCNDASPDGTLAAIGALAERHPRLRVLDNPENLGLVPTMGRLLAAASGDYIAYLDGDDLALPGKLQAQVDHLDAHPDCGIVFHDCEVFDSDSGAVIKRYSRDYYNAAYIPPRSSASHLVRYGTYLNASSVMIRRHDHLADALGHGCRIICDYPWHIGNALLGGGSIDRLVAPLGRYRIHAGSFGAQTDRDRARRVAVTRELEQACRFAGELGLAPDFVAQGVAHARFSAALYFLRAGADALFTQFIDESAAPGSLAGWWFDARHERLHGLRHEPGAARHYLGWKHVVPV